MALARWPRRIPSGAVCDEPGWSPDLLLACLTLAGCSADSKRPPLDGRNPLAMWTDGAASPHQLLLFEYGKHAALRKGPWKIVRERPGDPWQLYHVVEDASETRDLAPQEPKLRDELAAAFQQRRELARGRSSRAIEASKER